MTYEEAIFFAEIIKENGVISESFKLLEDGTVVEHTITKLSEEGIEMIELAVKAMELQVAKKVTAIEGGCGRKIPMCPSCECLLVESEIATERCCECGQLLDTEDWSEE